MSEEVVKPTRYTRGSIETWDAIAGLELGFLEGNVLKYISRYKDKNGIQDLQKAMVYLSKLISVESGENYYDIMEKPLKDVVKGR